jgi:hypothetical protein
VRPVLRRIASVCWGKTPIGDGLRQTNRARWVNDALSSKEKIIANVWVIKSHKVPIVLAVYTFDFIHFLHHYTFGSVIALGGNWVPHYTAFDIKHSSFLLSPPAIGV